MLPTQQEECFSHIVQDFLVCTTIHKARQLGVYQGEIVVRVTLDKTHRQTRFYANSENPYFNEYFVFEIHATLVELLRLTILYEVKKRTTCKKYPVLGELLIDMQSVWNQPNRCYFKKWGRLEVPIGFDSTTDTSIKGRGFLQIDLAIVSQASNPNTLLRPFEEDIMSMNKWQINRDYDDIEKNLLQNIDSDLMCNIRYIVIFYRGQMLKKSDYLLQFRFHPFKGKTSVVKSTQQPVWNQEITFAWTYPSLAQTFLIQLLSNDHLLWKCTAEYELHFEEIAFKDKPALGPTYIHFYDNSNGLQYVGRILLEIRSECLSGEPVKEMHFKNINALDEKRYWLEEYFIVEFLPLQGDFIRTNGSNCKLVIKLAEHQSNYIECYLKSYSFKKSAASSQHFIHSVRYFRHEMPFKAITLQMSLPDNRLKYESDIFLQELLGFVEYEIEAFKMFQIQYSSQYYAQVKVLRAIIMSLIKRVEEANEKKRFELSSFREPTIWDNNRLIYLKEYFETKLPDYLKSLRNRLKPSKDSYIDVVIEEILQEMRNLAHKLQSLLTVTELQDNWPDLILVLITGTKEIAFCRLNAKHFLNAPAGHDLSSNSQCWKIRNFIFKDIQCQHTCLNCGCMMGIVQGCLSIIAENERTDFFAGLNADWKRPEPFYWSPNIQYTLVKGRIFIHQAKVRPGSDQSGLCDPYVRVMICGHSAETAILYATLSPIWNSVIDFDNIVLPGPLQWYINNPPLVAVEVYDTDKKTTDDYLGCGYLPVSVISSDWADSNTREEPDKCPSYKLTDAGKFMRNKPSLQKFQCMRLLSPPPLKWVSVTISGSPRAEILMSGELVELNNQDPTSPAEESAVVTIGIPSPIRPIMKNFVLEVVFAGFRNYHKGASSVGARHRVKVMMGELLLSSGLSMSRIKHSINFLILYSSGVVSLPSQLEYWPALIATDVAVSGNGAETTLGAVIISDSKRFLQHCKEIKCFAPEEEEDNSLASTNVQIEEDEHAETVPLINSRKEKVSTWKRILSLSYCKRNQKSSEETYDLADVLDESNYNWWTKFYNSSFAATNSGAGRAGCVTLSPYKHRLRIYQNELEKEAEFSHFTDWAEPLAMVHGVKYKKNALPQEEAYATLKLNIKITPCQCEQMDGGEGSTLRPLAAALNPKYQAQIQALAELVKVVVRVYIVQGIQFRPRENAAQADAYVKIQFGQRNITNRANYVPNECNPIFGKCYQLEGVLPREHVLELSVFNRNNVRDEVIGSTFIDLEDRWRTKHRATVGLPYEYSSYGYNKWRDYGKPSEILSELCIKHNIKAPKINGNFIEIDGVALEDESKIDRKEDLEERLSLTVLHNLDRLPTFGYKLVPEHVETRSLYRNDYPGIEQGKIQLWIELFDANLNIPPPIDLTPEPPHLYELRVIVHQCSDVMLQEANIFGKLMSDIYVKGWCSNPDEYQLTDIHYRSLNGEAQFNWRMVFPLKYSMVEDMMVIKRSSLLDEYEIKQPPKLFIQIFDKDVISADDFIGMLELHISNFLEPPSTAKTCRLTDNNLETSPYFNKSSQDYRKVLNLFRHKKIKGWFPLKGWDVDTTTASPPKLTGKIELELEIVTEAEAASYPVGLGRDAPQPLTMPARPDTSFNFLTHPFKSLRKIIFPGLSKYLVIVAVAAIAIYALIVFIMKLPLLFIFGLG